MKKLWPVILMLVWIMMFGFAYKLGFTNMSIEELQHLVKSVQSYAYIVFILLFTSRLLLFIPSSVFIVAGGIIFSPLESIPMAFCSMFLAETIIYIIARHFADSPVHRYISKKYPQVYLAMEKNQSKYLFLVVASPMAPTDAACFVAASMKMKYGKFIMTVLAGNIPIILLYTFFGKTLIHSPAWGIVMGAILIFLCIAVSINRKKRNKHRLEAQEHTI
ncbi:VTT domain-containing protein [Bacillus sp. 165]|uniref:TVP38/TMEM64 family protein n=1 Tax=Bacillus sp. 165 TaxID=1529117 RepID=UPI001AD9BAD9|nr:VTT domain-containing protein [Bacillus sp. 165]MBO9130757.1 TVP38/TMEM64 family protein [Bacillus sp. 165]